MMDSSLGIVRDEKNPGFKHFYLRPQVDESGKMTWAKGHYDSVYGRIESSWAKTAEGWKFVFQVPGNTTATLELPNLGKDLTCNGKKVDWKESIQLGSGKYTFMVK